MVLICIPTFLKEHLPFLNGFLLYMNGDLEAVLWPF